MLAPHPRPVRPEKAKESAMYVDGFVLPVPDKNFRAYKKLAELSAKVWLDHGALHYVECRADDVKPGKLTSFPQAVLLKKGESVWFSWIVYKSRKDRDRVMKKVMSDPRLAAINPKNMPLDGKRMFFGGFKMVVEKKPRAAKAAARGKAAAPARRKRKARKV
jgi:uncharacterized protein YbaA (DUF1428 family)